MKEALTLCSLALNPSSPSPTSSMVRISDGFCQSYGGTFCISVPVDIDIGCCFSPKAVANFYRKGRKAVSFKLHRNKLVLQEGKEKLSIPFLPPDDMVTLDVISKPRPIALDMKCLKLCSDIIDPSHSKVSCQGVSFRIGMMESSNGRVVVSAVTDFDDNIEFNLPVASAKALLKFKSEIVAISTDQRAVKFHMKDGSSLTSLSITEQLVDTAQFYAGKWKPVNLKKGVAEDLQSIDCDSLIFFDGNISYIKELAEGELSQVCDKGFDVKAGKSEIDSILQISHEIALSEDNNRLQAFADNCRGICVTQR